ncbi:hypothetical protein OsI_09262 [Oryza sativa Indica Group]|uniref:Uncharacterized protein n=1 Tax=Oryza sativa subsp. indica TaxID=39946 RepID=B8AE39_ORYSI|nr:hypothetical protein OsI_09262 [Oryza sativa Indica Group]
MASSSGESPGFQEASPRRASSSSDATPSPTTTRLSMMITGVSLKDDGKDRWSVMYRPLQTFRNKMGEMVYEMTKPSCNDYLSSADSEQDFDMKQIKFRGEYGNV